jgi:predicted lipid-binding transport protein (Tim44 family)
MVAVLRQRLARRWFGEGMAGAVAMSVAGYAWRKLSEGVRRDPELLDVSTLKPGETYTISTRPAPSRRERKLAKKTGTARAKVQKATRTTRAQRGTARALDRAQRKAGRAQVGSVAHMEQSQRADKLEQRYQLLVAHTARQQRLIDSLATLEAELQAEQDARLAKARRKAPRPRRRVWGG